MTNKLEEVFKELQESHVLVDREEYEKLVEKAKEAEIEAVKFEAGGYYAFEDAIFKIEGLGESHHITSFYGKDEDDEDYIDDTFIIYTDSLIATSARKATDEEIKLFKRAEMYHKHGRKLDELKSGDFVHYVNENSERTSSPRMPYDNVPAWIETIQRGEGAIYLTAEEHHEAHKKIAGE